MTTKWIKQVTLTGLSFMTREAQQERMNRVFVNGDEISGPALAELINECKAAASAFLVKQNSSRVITKEQKSTIRKMLELTDGKNEVAAIGLTEDIDWLIELRDKVYSTGITVADLTQN